MGRFVPWAMAVATASTVACVGRRVHRRWGATAEEQRVALPGDALLDRADLTCTRAIGIDAPPAAVWPWLAQLGQERGGFYSYDRLENLAGCQVRSAEEIVEAWQHPAPGDPFHLHPQVALEVAAVEEGSALIVAGIAEEGADGPPYDFTWAFVVVDAPGGSRLVVRERYRYRGTAAALVVEPLAAVSWFMTQRMLRGIRARVEAASR